MPSVPTTIRTVTVQSLDIPMWESFGIAGGTQEMANNLLVSVELADGTCGYGEAAPLPPFNNETQETARTALTAVQTIVEGADVREWRRIAVALRDIAGKAGSARCALETAILDALTRRAGMPMWAFFGGMTTQLETDMTITTQTTMTLQESIRHAAASARKIHERGIRIIKTKVGGSNSSSDLQRIKAIRNTVPDAPLMLDGNCGYQASEALALLKDLRKSGIVPILFEQPVRKDDWEGLCAVTQEGGVPVAADESVNDAATAQYAIQMKAVNVVNIKLMKCGVAEALDIAILCRAAGLRLMIGGMVESILGMTMSACFAGGLGGFDYVDLDTPLFMKSNPFIGGFLQSGGCLQLKHIQAGHGVSPAQIIHP